MRQPMTKEQFQSGIKQIVADARDPNGEFAGIRQDFLDLHADIEEHDPELAAQLAKVNFALDNFVEFATARVES